MVKEKHWLKRRMAPLAVFLLAALLYLTGGACAKRGDWVHVAGYLTGSLMLTIMLATELVHQRLDERLQRLEQLLEQQCLRPGERATRATEPKKGNVPE